MRRELAYLRAEASGSRAWLRLHPPLMPLLTFLYCLFVKGLILNGRAGIFYSLQRLIAEATLSLMSLEERLREKGRDLQSTLNSAASLMMVSEQASRTILFGHPRLAGKQTWNAWRHFPPLIVDKQQQQISEATFPARLQS